MTLKRYDSYGDSFEESPGNGRFEVWRNQLADHNYILITNNGKVARINIEGLCNSGVV